MLKNVLILTAAAATMALAQTQQTKTTGGGLDEAIRAYILAHPEVTLESVRLHQQRQAAAQEAAAREAVAAKQDLLLRDPASPAAGKANGVTVVEFFDYRCGYCKKAGPTVAKLLAANPNVRVVYKELPILGPDSLVAARAALAAHKQGGYEKMHRALLGFSEAITPESMRKVAEEQGLDGARLAADMLSPDVDAAIAKNRELAESLNVQATPTFVVGNTVVPGLVDVAKLESLVSDTAAPGQRAAAK